MPDTASSDRIEDLLAGLNPPQRDAVTHGQGPLLILAGAGTGKTRVLTHRIAFLEGTGMARANEILAITFTNKAAQEMRDRVELLLGRRTRAMWVMTFHAACARMLRADAPRLGYTRQFTIYDQADARRLVKRCLEGNRVDTKRYTPGAVHHQISDAKNKMRDADAYGQMVGSYFEQTVADAYRLYERELHRMNAMDFDDLLVNAVNVLQLFQEVRDRYSTAFRHVLVDEYQDTNAVQYRWLQLLAGEHRNLAVVGDDAQSIYGFRGADITNILSFEDTFPDARVVKLEQNYRSTQTILSAANAVIAHNREQKHKSLWTNLGDGEPIRIRELDDEHAEARYVVGEIERLVDEGASRAEIAVFYRTNAQSRVIEDTLVRRDISYQVIGGTKFYERAEIKDAIAYLTVLGNPQDVVSFTRIVNSPRRGIGQTSLGRVIAFADSTGISIWDAAADAAAVPGLGTAAVRAMSRFMETISTLRERAEQRVPVGDLLESLLHETGYIDALKAERTIEAQGREENLAELVEVAREFDASAEEDEDTLDVFLQQIALVADADTRTDDEGLVTLMTIHNAKGLEYPIVFIAGMEEGVFPHSRALDEGGLEEERRLAYVGITRAMRALYMTSARRRAVFGATQYGMRSRFLDEVPHDLTDKADEPRVRAGLAAQRPGSWASSRASTPLDAEPERRRRGRRRGRRDRGRALRRRRQRAQAHGRVRPAHQALIRTRGDMTAQVIDGKAIAARVRGEVAQEVELFATQHGGEVPGLATILVGDDPASALYVNGKQKACREVGMKGFNFPLPAAASREEVEEIILRLNGRPDVSGILLQLPLPGHLDGVELTGMIDASKDVDGLTAVSAGLLALGRPGLRPCTPSGVMHLLDEAGAELEGAEAVVIGRSNLFGKPMAQLLLGANATVTTCHSRTRDLAAVCRRADVLIAAVGRAQIVKADWVKPGATVIDVGMNRLDGRLVGDVDFEAVEEVAAVLTPVPGGVGPMTIAFLLRNTLQAARMQRGASRW